MSGTKVYDKKLMFAEQVASKFFRFEDKKNSRRVYSKYLKGLDGTNDFILIEQQGYGYAIFSSEDMQLVEYSDKNVSPYSELSVSESYYAGPGNYFINKNDKMTSMNTGEVLDKSVLSTMAEGIKNKISPNKKELQSIKDDNVDIASASKSTIGDYNDLYDLGEFKVCERKLIDGASFFLNKIPIPNNQTGTCMTVAAHMLLAFNNWYFDGRIITNPDFLLRYNNGVLKQNLLPYDTDYMGATYEDNEEDNVTTLYEKLLEYIDPQENGATIGSVFSGIRYYYLNYVSDDVSFTLEDETTNANYAQQRVKELIDGNKPSLITIEYIKNSKNERHGLVAYGYQTFIINNIEQFGYIAHFGWNRNNPATWFNSSWVDGYLSFNVSHEHDFLPLNENEQHIVYCQECNTLSSLDNHIYISCLYEKKYGVHIKKCNCGYTKLEEHNYSFIVDNMFPDVYHHEVCVDCGFTNRDKEHYIKNGYCWYCGHVV